MLMIKAVAGILLHEDKILVAKRPIGKPYSGYFEFPGGKIEKHETSYEALVRELYEELGVLVISAQAICQHAHTYPDKDVMLDVWLVSHFSGTPEGKENQELTWVTWQQLTTLNVLEGNIAIIRFLSESRLMTQLMQA